MATSTLRLGLAQLYVEGGAPGPNLERAAAMIHDAALKGAQVVVLPECMDIGWLHSSTRTISEPIPGRSSRRLSEAAAADHVHVVAGIVERDGNQFFNAAVVIGPDGRILLKHRKIHELSIAHELYSPGDRLGVVHTPIGVLGLNICADNFADSHAIGHVLARMGAQIIISPSAWAVPPDYDNVAEPYGQMWETSYASLARLYDMPVVGVSNVGTIADGPWSGWNCIGCSLAIGADGAVLAKGDYGVAAQQLLLVDIPLHQARPWGTALTPVLREKGYHGP